MTPHYNRLNNRDGFNDESQIVFMKKCGKLSLNYLGYSLSVALLFWTNYCTVKPNCSNFRTVMAIILGVPIFSGILLILDKSYELLPLHQKCPSKVVLVSEGALVLQ